MKKNMEMIFLVAFIFMMVDIMKYLSLYGYLSAESLMENKQKIILLIQNNFILFTFIYVFLYFIIIILSLPGTMVLTVAGGFIYSSLLGLAAGTLAAALFINIATTGGAVFIFMLIRNFFGEKIKFKYRHQFSEFNKEIEKNEINYLVTACFIPLFPFSSFVILAGLTKVKLSVFVCTVFIGLAPRNIAYANVGRALNEFLINGSINYRIFLALILLELFFYLPLIYDKFIKNKS